MAKRVEAGGMRRTATGFSVDGPGAGGVQGASGTRIRIAERNSKAKWTTTGPDWGFWRFDVLRNPEQLQIALPHT